MKKISLFLFIILVAFSTTVVANDDKYLANLIHNAKAQQLSKEKVWLSLLHYRKNDSAITQEDFFLSNVGRTNPKAELLATLNAFFAGEISGSEHPLCRFVARRRWLTEQLNIEENRLPTVTCNDYIEWRKNVPSAKVTLVFPAYYLNSPSSMFGHTLLRLDPEDGENWSNWLSYAVNFGATVDNTDNSLIYAYKGLMGGYPGNFAVMPYYKKILEYSRIERRDIWEYSLNLTPEEVNKLVEHLWELKNVTFDYFFFTENCSYRLLELLEVARPSAELTDEFAVTAIPVDTVRAIEREGMLTTATYRPSRGAVLQSRIQLLNADEENTLSEVMESSNPAVTDLLAHLPENRQLFIAETAYKLIRFRQNKRERDKDKAKKSYQLLSLINKYPVGTKQTVTAPKQPEKGHLSGQWLFKVGERDNKRYTELGFRMAFHSLEDNEEGFLRGAQINIGQIRLRRSEENTLFLQQLDIVNIFSLTPRTTFFTPLSWRVKGGLERVYRDGQDRLVSHVSGGVGYAWNATPNNLTYSLLTARVEGGSSFKTFVEPALGVTTGMLIHTALGTGRLELAGEKFSGGENTIELKYVQNIVLSKNTAIKLSAQREWLPNKQISEIGISYQLHF